MFEYQAQICSPNIRPVLVHFIDLDDRIQADRFYSFLAALPPMSGQPAGTIPDRVDLAPAHPMEGASYLVARLDDQVVGAVAVLRNELAARWGYHMAHVARFRVDVLPEWREEGVVQALVGGLIAWAKRPLDGPAPSGLRRLETSLLAGDEALVAVLESAGFVVEGRARAAWHVRTPEEEFDLDVLSLGLLAEEARPVSLTMPTEEVDPTIPDLDCAPFFDELVGQVRAFLPYELRGFETCEMVNELHILFDDLPEGVSFGLAFRLASEAHQTPDMIELGLHFRREPEFNQAEVERLRARLDELGQAVGGKTLHADVWHEGWGRVALRLPYTPPDQAQAFMLAAQVAGFITVMLPQARAEG